MEGALTSRFMVDASFMGFENYFTQKETEPWITPDIVSVMDTGTGMTNRSSPRDYNQKNQQPLIKGSAAYVTGSHAIKVGGDFQWGYTLFEANRRNQGTQYMLNNGSPRQLALIISPYSERENFHQFSTYAQDQWMMDRITINAGLRFDYAHQSVPVQTSGPGPNTPFQTWPEFPISSAGKIFRRALAWRGMRLAMARPRSRRRGAGIRSATPRRLPRPKTRLPTTLLPRERGPTPTST